MFYMRIIIKYQILSGARKLDFLKITSEFNSSCFVRISKDNVCSNVFRIADVFSTYPASSSHLKYVCWKSKILHTLCLDVFNYWFFLPNTRVSYCVGDEIFTVLKYELGVYENNSRRLKYVFFSIKTRLSRRISILQINGVSNRC